MHKVIIGFVVLIFVSNIGLSLFRVGTEQQLINIIWVMDLIYLLCLFVLIVLYKIDEKKNPENYEKINAYSAKLKIKNDLNEIGNNPSTGFFIIKKSFFYKLFLVAGLVVIIFGMYEIIQYFLIKDITHLKKGISFIVMPVIFILSILKAKPLR